MALNWKDQFSVARKVAARLVSPTVFEVEGWKRIEAIPLVLAAFGVIPRKEIPYLQYGRQFGNSFRNHEADVGSVSLISEEVDLPISVGNCHFTNDQPNTSTFIVRSFFIYNGICLVVNLSNRTILPKIGLTGQFEIL